jgi:hypothetical protein
VRLEQIGFIRGRFILVNVIAIWEGMEWARAFGLDALFIKIDFEKEYDLVEWSFILAMLKALSFGPSFLCAIEMLFGAA